MMDNAYQNQHQFFEKIDDDLEKISNIGSNDSDD